MIRVAIVDDDMSYIDALKAHTSRYGHENGVNIEISTFQSGLELISDYEPIYDIIFLDIEMPHMNGIEVAKSIRKSDPHGVIIFVTNMPQFAVEGYEVDAFDYIMKPIEYFAFSIKLKGAIEAIEKVEASLLIPWEDGSRNVLASEVIYIEVNDHWLYVHTVEASYQMIGTLKEMEEQLKAHHFIRCNKSYLINLQHVIRMRSDLVIMQGDYKVKISRAKRKEVQFAFIDYYSQHHGQQNW